MQYQPIDKSQGLERFELLGKHNKFKSHRSNAAATMRKAEALMKTWDIVIVVLMYLENVFF